MTTQTELNPKKEEIRENAAQDLPIEKTENTKKKKKKEKKKKTVAQEIMSWVWTLLAAVVIATVIRAYVFEPVRVDGKSMTNTLQNGEILLVNKMIYQDTLLSKIFYKAEDRGFHRNDVVICRYPDRLDWSFHFGAALSLEQHTIFVKRLVALPGDTVEIKDSVLYVNGEAVPDPENMASQPGDYPLRKLNADEYFVIGDNRRTSHDSRSADVGPISGDMIMGKAVSVILPFGNRRSVE